MVHPVQSVIESLYSAGRCPRLHVNASHDDVICPDFIREQWKERLIIDLDASYPLDLTFDDKGLAADLSFGGFVTRCEFPWEAVYIVADRATGRGIVLDRNMPTSVRAMFEKSRSESAKSKGPDLRPVSAVDDSDSDAPMQVVGAAPTLREAPFLPQEVEDASTPESAPKLAPERRPKLAVEPPTASATGENDKPSAATDGAVDNAQSKATSGPIALPSRIADEPEPTEPAPTSEPESSEPESSEPGPASEAVPASDSTSADKPATAAKADPASAEPEGQEPEGTKDSDEKQVQRRRAAFRVIDGGG